MEFVNKDIKFRFLNVNPSIESISKASIELKRALKTRANLEANKDLFGIQGEVAVVGKFNKNDDAITPEDAINCYKLFEEKFIDVRHDTSNIIGHITNAGLCDYESGNIISEDQARSMNYFCVLISGVIYRALGSWDLFEVIRSTIKEDELFGTYAFSWEIGYSDYDIALCESDKDDIYSCERISSDKPDWIKYARFLRAKGGNGKTADGKMVKRILKLTHPFGIGFTKSPAADVRPMIPTLDINGYLSQIETSTASHFEGFSDAQELYDQALSQSKKKKGCADDDEDEKEDKNDDNDEPLALYFLDEKGNFVKLSKGKGKKKGDVENNSKKNEPINTSSIVNINEDSENKDMDKKKIEEILKSAGIENISVAESLFDTLKTETINFNNQLEAEKKEKESLAEKNKESLAELENVKKELDEIKKEQETSKAQVLFSERMSTIDSQYEMDKDERALISSKISSLDNSENSFAEYKKELDVLWKNKKKETGTSTAEDLEKARQSAQTTIPNSTQGETDVKKGSSAYFAGLIAGSGITVK